LAASAIDATAGVDADEIATPTSMRGHPRKLTTSERLVQIAAGTLAQGKTFEMIVTSE
jgi:hypothetical protein